MEKKKCSLQRKRTHKHWTQLRERKRTRSGLGAIHFNWKLRQYHAFSSYASYCPSNMSSIMQGAFSLPSIRISTSTPYLEPPPNQKKLKTIFRFLFFSLNFSLSCLHRTIACVTLTNYPNINASWFSKVFDSNHRCCS